MIITKANKKELPPYVNGLIYGLSGIGKTVLATTAPAPLIISAEDGLLSISNSNVDTVDIRNLKDCIEVYNFLFKGEHEYETAIIDSISELAQVLLEEYKPGERDKRQAYGKMADEILHMVRRFRKLPMHVFFNAKMSKNIDEFTGRTTFGPKFPGKVLPQEMPFQLDEVLAMRFHKHEGKDYRVLQTEPDISYDAKDRSGNLARLEQPDLARIINKCLGLEISGEN